MSDDERQVVVIGSGPAGATAARELVQSGIRVTMLEAGTEAQRGLLLRFAGKNFYRRTPPLGEEGGHVISGDPQTVCYAKLAPGGLSNNWTGAVPRFAPEDFTEGERLHERYVWPITYSDISPYYEKVERSLEITADPRDVPQMPGGHVSYQYRLPSDWQDVERAANKHGQGFTTYPLADGPPNMLVGRGTAFNSYYKIVRPLFGLPNFRLRTGAHALQLQWSPTTGKVDAVIYHCRRTGMTKRMAASAVIVACGPLGSAKLLHNSTCNTFPDGIGNSKGVLGRYLHDHPREWWSFQMDRPLSILSPSGYLTRRPYDSSPPLLATSWTLGTASLKDRIRSRFGMKASAVGVQVIGTMIPSEQCAAKPSTLLKDEFGLPALDVHIHYSQAELDNVVRCRQHLMEVLADAGCHATLGAVVPTLFPGTIAHYGGTARMHAKPEYGVVDSWNRVHDAPNVLVCDASCFTTAAEKNPTLTVMAIAARAATRLAHDLKHA
ncbi:MAG TPA: GMC family oxidoreductase [Steroidobacteraceae bacterium]|jgi:choline dehydrogenase-like flavoprotein